MKRTSFAAMVLFCALAHADEQAVAPGFSCSKGHSMVEQMVCSDSGLAQLDRQLNELYGNLAAQPSTDTKALRHAEDKWLREGRNACMQRECVAQAYRDRIDALRQQGEQQASPAAYRETRPFPIEAATLREAQSHIGQSCTLRQDRQEPRLEHFAIDPGMRLPVLLKNNAVVVRRHHDERVAFLLHLDEQGRCRIADAVALPPASVAATLLFCSTFDPDSSGIGIRVRGQRHLAAYWSAGQTDELMRQPLGVLGAEDAIRCSEPESGE
jgi:uncharacterized protein